MKLFKVKTFIADPTTLDYRCFAATLMIFLIGCIWLALGVGLLWIDGGSGSSTVWFVAWAIFCCVGVVWCALREFIYHNQTEHDELTTRLTEQDERIRQLEAQVAALTPPRTP